MLSLLKTTYAGRALQAEGLDRCSRHQSSNMGILLSDPSMAVSAFHPLGQRTEFCVVYFGRFSYEPVRSSRLRIEDFLPHFPGALTFIPASLQHLVCKSRALGKEREVIFLLFQVLNTSTPENTKHKEPNPHLIFHWAQQCNRDGCWLRKCPVLNWVLLVGGELEGPGLCPHLS